MPDPRDVSGVWYGSYAGDQEDERNSFIAVLDEMGGGFTGTISEPDDVSGAGSGAVRRASVTGVRNGSALRFNKQYDGTGGWVHAVRYAGTIDSEGTLISGTWLLEGFSGRFTMEREQFGIEELEAEEEEIIVIGSPRGSGNFWSRR